jgi:hypothetical protein
VSLRSAAQCEPRKKLMPKHSRESIFSNYISILGVKIRLNRIRCGLFLFLNRTCPIDAPSLPSEAAHPPQSIPCRRMLKDLLEKAVLPLRILEIILGGLVCGLLSYFAYINHKWFHEEPGFHNPGEASFLTFCVCKQVSFLLYA